MATDFTIKRDDTLPVFNCTLKDAAGSLVNLTGCTVAFIMNDKATGVNKVLAAAAIVNAETGAVGYQWVVGDTDTAGTYNAEWEVKFGDGDRETFPNDKMLVVKVVADLEDFN